MEPVIFLIPVFMKIVIFLIPVVFLLTLISHYNTLIQIRNQCDEAWSNVDIEFKRRSSLIPNLIEDVKGYAEYERSLLTELVKLRESNLNTQSPFSSRTANEAEFKNVLSKLRVRLESYPDLKSSQSFLELQKELRNTEDRIQAALRFYNGNIRENNNQVYKFPSNIVANVCKFRKKEFFKLEDEVNKILPSVRF